MVSNKYMETWLYITYLYKYEVHFSLDAINLTDCWVSISNGYMQRVSAMSQKQTYLRQDNGW